MPKAFVPKPDWSAFDATWLNNYDASNYGRSLSSRILRSTHALIERNAGLAPHYPIVLEIGAGTMAHFPTVEHGFDRYIASDENAEVVQWLEQRQWDRRVEFEQISASDLPFENCSVDRIIATHVLEHVPDPVEAVTEWARVLKPGGVLSLILPCDPGLAWRLGRNLGPRRRGEDAGLPYDYYMAVEHRNAIFNLIQIVKFHFPKRLEKWWPLRVPAPDINLIYGANCFV